MMKTAQWKAPQLVVIAWGLMVGCGEPEVVCDNAECRQDALVETWLADPEKGAIALDALPDELERSAAVARLIEVDPSGVSQLCEQLPEGKLRVRCQRTSDRPHLWQVPSKSAVNEEGMVSGGSHSHRLSPAENRVSVYAHVAGDLGMCANADDPHTCAWARAMELSARGKARDAAVRCAAIEVENGPSPLWQAECRFTAAEAAIRVQGSEGYAGAVELCLSAGRFRERCLIHLSRGLAAQTPASDTKPGSALRATVKSADAVGRYWASDPAASRFVNHFWSLAIGYAYLRADSVTGDVLDGVPASVIPHVHAAAAWRLMQLQGEKTQTLAQWADALDSALKLRAGKVEREMGAVHMPGVGNLWPDGKEDSHAASAVIYMGMGSRGSTEDTEEDRLISLLEAAARQDPPMDALLVEGAAHPSEIVRWTAVRLQGALEQSAKIKSQLGN